ncbi:hypothetical protein SLEP1_g11264 [Rubroshorea leprosula]|uniref:Uncharacterized protein n=1 Tax=Rubroshorea leprosula TaxID=152421 RepID=A0AAV5IKU0_9ROSI|nr:hypothetical protein SLEP1_g11264 [Rubroshorea leprosula]
MLMLQQKTKIDWLRLGGSNTAYHNAKIKERHAMTRITSSQNSRRRIANEYEISRVPNFYKSFLDAADSLEDRPGSACKKSCGINGESEDFM